jgi:preprotein translocase subunit SecD
MSDTSFRLRCPNCDGVIEETDIYCPRCGLNLSMPFEKIGPATPAPENLESAPAPERSRKKFIIAAAIIGLLVLMIAAAAIAYSGGQPDLAPQVTAVFEPDLSRVSVSGVPRAELEQTAQILKQRWAAFGYPDTSFTVSNHGQIIGRIPKDADPDLINRTKAVGIVEFVDFGPEYYEVGTQVTTDLGVRNFSQVDGPKGRTLMTNAEIKTVSASRDQYGNYMIDFTLNDKGTQILADYTTHNIGSYLGIIMDKTVISCPSVNGAITQGSGVISGVFTYETANTLALYMRTTPLPIPLK